ncbi:MAG TPA: hypothetical protein VD838_09140 [Anaeromyxobacteraceae bacterium]|nr:hypothetical protein [Anaeromyxobacteraceae bacterium]
MREDLVSPLVEDVRAYVARNGSMDLAALPAPCVHLIEDHLRAWVIAWASRSDGARISAPDFLAYFHAKTLLAEIDRLRTSLARAKADIEEASKAATQPIAVPAAKPDASAEVIGWNAAIKAAIPLVSTAMHRARLTHGDRHDVENAVISALRSMPRRLL